MTKLVVEKKEQGGKTTETQTRCRLVLVVLPHIALLTVQPSAFLLVSPCRVVGVSLCCQTKRTTKRNESNVKSVWNEFVLFYIKFALKTIKNTAIMSSGNSSRIHHFKLVLLGDTAVGKSCLVVRFVRDEFFEFQEPTIGGTITCILVSIEKEKKCENGKDTGDWPRTMNIEFLSVVIIRSFRVLFVTVFFTHCFDSFTAAFLTQTVQLDDATVKFEIW